VTVFQGSQIWLICRHASPALSSKR
jgi:hypothetical protein